MRDARIQAEARRASTWIERFALPLTVSVMEAQPATLIIVLLAVLVAGTSATPPFGVGSIALVALGLQWWAMFAERLAARRFRGKQVIVLHALGWLIAFAVFAGPYLIPLDKIENIFTILIGTALVTWFWRRGMSRAQAGFEYGALARSFKVGFGIVLGILVIAIVFPELQTLRDTLSGTLPLFFLSGLIMLSLARLGAIRTAHRATNDSHQADPTRPWLLALTLFGLLLIVMVIIIESVFSFASFELILTALTPLWNALGTLVGWILYGIIFILSPIFNLISWLTDLLKQHATSNPQQQSTKPPKSPLSHSLNSRSIPPEILTIGRWVLLVLVLLVVLLVVRASLRRWFARNDNEGIEEVREKLDARSLLGNHWREWWNRRRRRSNSAIALEPLDPTSARAHYREMLQAIAATKEELARYPTETPVEYEARLFVRLKGESIDSEGQAKFDVGAAEGAVLEELTSAYIRERYGGKHTDDHQRANLRIWVPRLIGQLTNTAPNRASKRRSNS